jgi:hypothetical protein
VRVSGAVLLNMSRVMRHSPLAACLALINAHEAAVDLEPLAFACDLRRRDRRERAALKCQVAVDDGFDGRPRLAEVVCAAARA